MATLTNIHRKNCRPIFSIKSNNKRGSGGFCVRQYLLGKAQRCFFCVSFSVFVCNKYICLECKVVYCQNNYSLNLIIYIYLTQITTHKIITKCHNIWQASCSFNLFQNYYCLWTLFVLVFWINVLNKCLITFQLSWVIVISRIVL